MPATAHKWAERFQRFAEVECRGLSPLYETVSLAIARDLEMLDWIAGLIETRADPTLLFAAVHYVLLSGVDGVGLAAFYPNLADVPAPPERAYPAFRTLVDRERERLESLLTTRGTQTNEVNRCCYLLPAFVLAAKQAAKPLWIIDVGASAGLNLLFDRYAYDYGNGLRAGDATSSVKLRTQLRGNPELAPWPAIAGRVGLDLHPIDVEDEMRTRWLEACTWPEHVDRFRNLARRYSARAPVKPRVVEGNAIDGLRTLVDGADRDAMAVIVNTNVLQYFPPEECERYGRRLADLASRRELIWIANEHPFFLERAGFTTSTGKTNAHSALPLAMTHFVEGERRERLLANVGPHARWLEWLA
jgi:hypothetical protein